MNIIVCGLNHTTAPIALREKVSLADDQRRAAFRQTLMSMAGVLEVVVVSTCNRTEIVCHVDKTGAISESILNTLAIDGGIDVSTLATSWYCYEGEAALLHLFEVASSLDSLVVGEAQILGQLKSAYEESRQAGMVNGALHRLFHRTFAVAKKVRNETRIGTKPVSVSAIAVDCARTIFESLDDKVAVIVGLGKMSHLAIRHLKERGLNRFVIVNRTHEKALSFAKAIEAEAMPFESLKEALVMADVAIFSTSTTDPLVTADDAQVIMGKRQGRPLLMIDIGLPRNVSPHVAGVEGVYLFDMDDLSGVAQANRKEREDEATKARAIVKEEATAFTRETKHVHIIPTLTQLSQKYEQIRQHELSKALSRLNGVSPETQATIDQCTQAIVNKILHDPILHLKESASESQGGMVDYFRRIFRLE